LIPVNFGRQLVNRVNARFSIRGSLHGYYIANGYRLHAVYTNELHEALLRKDGPTFWKCWRSKFETSNKCIEVDGCVGLDDAIIADKFVQHFFKWYCCNMRNNSKPAMNMTVCEQIIVNIRRKSLIQNSSVKLLLDENAAKLLIEMG